MAAICGILRFDGAPTAGELVRRISARMRHRSPDGIALWQQDRVALASGALHASLHAHKDRQPIRLEDGAVLVVDGRIDDRRTLAAALEISPPQLDSMGDGQLFGAAWLRWREALWQHVMGDYALAVWEPQREQLSLVRDRIGVRPLFWAQTPAMVAFASEPEALLGIDGIPSAPNPDRVANLLAPAFDDGDRGATFYRGIRRVIPGEVLEAGMDGGVRARRYWAFGPLEPLRLPSIEAYVEAFREVFDDAVRVRVASPTLPALMLSGGIDSAAVHASALAQALPLKRVSVAADRRGAEEEQANIDASLAQAPHALRLQIPGLHAQVDLPRLVREVFEHAQPTRNSITLPMLANMAAAAGGSRVVLDGIDGDLVMSTPKDYVGRMALAGHPLAALREARAASRRHTYLRHFSAARILVRGVASRLQPPWLAQFRARNADVREGSGPYHGLLHPEMATRLRLRDRMLDQRLRLLADPALRDWTGSRHWVWTNPGLMRGMEGFDLAAARFGVEARHPWCDHRVVDFFQRVPMHVVVRDGWTKWSARAAYSPELGRVAWHSGKRHLGPEVTRTLLAAGKPWVDEALLDVSGVAAEWIDPDVMARLSSAWRSGECDSEANDLIFSIVTLRKWLLGLRDAGAG